MFGRFPSDNGLGFSFSSLLRASFVKPDPRVLCCISATLEYDATCPWPPSRSKSPPLRSRTLTPSMCTAVCFIFFLRKKRKVANPPWSIKLKLWKYSDQAWVTGWILIFDLFFKYRAVGECACAQAESTEFSLLSWVRLIEMDRCLPAVRTQ